MATIKSYTDLEQSKKLAEILPLESADMYYTPPLIKGHTDYIPHLKRKLPIDWGIEQAIPCWSLAALLNVLPPIHHLKPILDLEENSIQYSGIDIYVKADNPVDACYEVILKLHELNLL